MSVLRVMCRVETRRTVTSFNSNFNELLKLLTCMCVIVGLCAYLLPTKFSRLSSYFCAFLHFDFSKYVGLQVLDEVR